MQREGLVGDRPAGDRGADGINFLLLCRRHAGGSRAAGGAWLSRGADVGNLLLRCFVAGIDLRGMQELGQGALLVAGLQQLAALGHVDGRSRTAARDTSAVADSAGPSAPLTSAFW